MVSSLLESYPDFVIQDSTNTDIPKFSGFARKDGKWYVVRVTNLNGVMSYRYATPSNNPFILNYSAAWTAKDTLIYEYIYQVLI